MNSKIAFKLKSLFHDNQAKSLLCLEFGLVLLKFVLDSNLKWTLSMQLWGFGFQAQIPSIENFMLDSNMKSTLSMYAILRLWLSGFGH